mmetsp:Transcript_45749/g.82794  ORF Transcript_45749/g.82794 Transcript_45749/m.82794 type:complete len:281 (-) Transcript_45749:664-1506(-)
MYDDFALRSVLCGWSGCTAVASKLSSAGGKSRFCAYRLGRLSPCASHDHGDLCAFLGRPLRWRCASQVAPHSRRYCLGLSHDRSLYGLWLLGYAGAPRFHRGRLGFSVANYPGRDRWLCRASGTWRVLRSGWSGAMRWPGGKPAYNNIDVESEVRNSPWRSHMGLAHRLLRSWGSEPCSVFCTCLIHGGGPKASDRECQIYGFNCGFLRPHVRARRSLHEQMDVQNHRVPGSLWLYTLERNELQRHVLAVRRLFGLPGCNASGLFLGSSRLWQHTWRLRW